MNLNADIDLGEGLRLRTLTDQDAALLVEATRAQSAPALWGPHPRGPYSIHDAHGALRAWDPDTANQASYGIVGQGGGQRGGQGGLLGALGLMPDGPHSAELAYWVRPEYRRQGLALRSIQAFTHWAHTGLEFSRIWLEINPGNVASLRLADRAGYHFEERLPRHCRAWTSEDPDLDSWHDCLIWTHTEPAAGPAIHS